jgi:hypothetical protein
MRNLSCLVLVEKHYLLFVYVTEGIPRMSSCSGILRTEMRLPGMKFKQSKDQLCIVGEQIGSL